MDQQAQVTISDVQAEAHPEGRFGPYTAYKVQTAQGFELFTTADKVGQRAQMARGQTVTAVYEIEPGRPRQDGGQFPPTYRLKEILGGDMYAQPAIPGLGAVGPQPSPPVAPPPAVPQMPAPPPAPQPAAAQAAGADERNLQIMRQSALERAIRMAAAGLSPARDLYDLTAVSDVLVAYFLGGREAMAAAARALGPVGAADGAGSPAAGAGMGASEPATAPTAGYDLPWSS